MSTVIENSSHGPGLTCLAFSPDGSRAFTGGQDCIVRIWKTDIGADQEPDTASEAEQGITSIATAHDCWLSGSEDTEVRRYVKDKAQLDGLVTSVSGVAIRCVSIDCKGKRVAVTSDEFTIKVVDMEDIMKVQVLRGHTRGIRKATWHPSGLLLTTCGSDGNIIIWDLSGDQTEPRAIKVIDGVIPAVVDAQSPEFLHDCSAVWHASGEYFFIASRGHEILTISRETWAKTSSYSDPKASGHITALALSINGVYLASASESKVHIWTTQTQRLLFTHTSSSGSTITQIAFSPSQNLLAWTDTDGVLTRWINPINDTFPDPVKPTVSSGAATTPFYKTLFGNHIEDESVIKDTSDVDLDAETRDMDNDWIIDDVEMLDDGSAGTDELVKEMVNITKAQVPFQPGSTPMDNKKRYLAYNMIGVIEVTDQDTHHIVNVEFFDQSARKGYHFADHFKYNLGYLGERGALFACQPESDHPAQVLYKPYGTWASHGEWTYAFRRKDTKILGIAVGGVQPSRSFRNINDADLQGFGNVVIATSESDLTFLSGTGRERHMIGLGVEFVSMVAGSDWVFVIHRAGSTTIDGSQNLSYTLINFEDFTVRQRDILPIPKGHMLKWIGVSEEGAPAVYDSAGWVHVLTKFRIPHHASWARLLDTNLLQRRQGKDESYWPVGITGSTFMCLILKGRQKYPGFPRPLIQDLPLQIPFRREDPAADERIARETILLEMSRDALDEELTTNSIATRELAMDKEFMRLIQAACKANNIPRAIELCNLLHHTMSFDKAVQIAEFYHLIGFKDKVLILKANRESEDRLVVARDKRKEWARADLPLRRPPSIDTCNILSHKPREDLGPPTPKFRPGLAIATPRFESTRYSAMGSSRHETNLVVQPSEDDSYLDKSPVAEAKRKRDDVEPIGQVTLKRRAIQADFAFPAQKQKLNPFLRNLGQESGKNPFARKLESNKTIQKSESFFDKVDAVEVADSLQKRSSSEKGKDKEKKDVSRQTTLFGLLPCTRQNTKKDSLLSRPQTIDLPKPDVQATLVETQPNEPQNDNRSDERDGSLARTETQIL